MHFVYILYLYNCLSIYFFIYAYYNYFFVFVFGDTLDRDNFMQVSPFQYKTFFMMNKVYYLFMMVHFNNYKSNVPWAFLKIALVV